MTKKTKEEVLTEMDFAIVGGDRSITPNSTNSYLKAIAIGIRYLVEKQK